jgi:hypothetical protein
MITHPKAIQLAITGLRLLRSLDPEVIKRTYETTAQELTEAIETIGSIKQIPSPIILTDEERPVAEMFTASLSEAIRIHTDFLANGNAKDFADYKRIAGIIAGLRKAADTYTEQLRIINER